MKLCDAKWIWQNSSPESDEYAEFLQEFDFFGKDAVLRISADSNYAVYLNGRLCAFGQYPDFPHDKVYDEIDLSGFVRRGKNILAIRVWYYGIEDSSTYCPGTASVIFTLDVDGKTLVSSSRNTLSRLSPAYVSHKVKRITVQLGLSFEYDSLRADGWMLGEWDAEYPFGSSVELDINPPLRLRSVKRTELGAVLDGSVVNKEGIKSKSEYGIIFDLGKEAVGFPCLSFTASEPTEVTVAFGEHLVDGHVRDSVGGRDFTFVYLAHEGENYYMNPFRRIGARFLELRPDKPISGVKVSMRSVDYPVNVLAAPEGLSEIQRKIYDACVNTLRCCMHDHYEDCPWREQALYCMDSRNQMLCGYYAFGEYEFPRGNLELMAADNGPEGFMSICFPVKKSRAIPSFSLHYIIECAEYLRYTDDVDFIRKAYPKLKSIVEAFLKYRSKDGLVPPIPGKGMWNFYEWQEGLDGRAQLDHGETVDEEPDVILNTLLSLSLSYLAEIESRLSIESDSLTIKSSINEAVNRQFYSDERGVYLNRASESGACKLGNALAILSGAAVGERAHRIAKLLTSEELREASLSMQCFVYDALIATDREGYKNYILGRIEKVYTPMLELGNGTVWETELGESDFWNAGSLCHGWSAMPIYYYHTLVK